MFTRRHGKLYLWPAPDGLCTFNVDYASCHPEAFEDILFGPEFNEAVFEGVITALYHGQLFEKLRPHMTLDGFRPDDVYYDRKPEKPKRNAKTVPCNIVQCFFRETRITGYRLKKAA